MILSDYFVGDPAVTIDRRASKIDVHHPGLASIELRASTQQAFDSLPDVPVYPAAIVREDGRLFIMSAGGSGLIWICGEPNAKQLKVAEKVYRTLRSMGAQFGFSQINGFPED